MNTGDRQAEMETADALLDIGISIPILQIKIPFTARHITLRATMRRPTMGSLMRIAKVYLAMGVKVDELKAMSKEAQFELLATHGDKIAEIVMLAILRDRLRIWLLGRPFKWLLMNYVSDEHLTTLNKTFVPFYGTRAFVNIIKSVEDANPLTPRVSH